MPGRWLLAALLACLPAAAAADATATGDVASAIERALRGRVGDGATIRVSDVTGVRIAGEPVTLVAAPEPAAKVSGRMRFLLSDARPGRPLARVGEATAAISVLVPAVKLARAVTRGERLVAADVVDVETSLDGLRLRPLPLAAVAIGARVTRDLSAGSVLAPGDLAAEPLVRAGDVVRTHVRFGAVEVIGVMVAAESGDANAVIRVTNQETHRAARARIVARGEVEVVNER